MLNMLANGQVLEQSFDGFRMTLLMMTAYIAFVIQKNWLKSGFENRTWNCLQANMKA